MSSTGGDRRSADSVTVAPPLPIGNASANTGTATAATTTSARRRRFTGEMLRNGDGFRVAPPKIRRETRNSPSAIREPVWGLPVLIATVSQP